VVRRPVDPGTEIKKGAANRWSQRPDKMILETIVDA
jgi:hypothetical protein